MIKTAFYQKVFSPVVPKVPKVSKKFLNKTVCIVGLGYVGLPLAQDFSKHIRTIGYRPDRNRSITGKPGPEAE